MTTKSDVPRGQSREAFAGSGSREDALHKRRAQNANVVPTTQHLADIARTYLADLEKRMHQNPQEILPLWAQVAGEAGRMTQAKRFENGVLYVSVKNSTVLSMLHQKKAALLSALRKKCPGIQLLDIMFRFG
jgi:predicted nucleic acid-binding Zn ribbon protein